MTMKRFELREFQDEIEVENDEEIVGFQHARVAGWREALVKVEETHLCGAELAGGGTCSREVDSPDETCWDHE